MFSWGKKIKRNKEKERKREVDSGGQIKEIGSLGCVRWSDKT